MFNDKSCFGQKILFSEEKTFSHDGTMVYSINVGDKLFDFFKKDSFISRSQVILINEGQFFTDLYKFTDYLVNKHNKKVFVCGLDGDFQRKIWSAIGYYQLCDELVKLKNICGIVNLLMEYLLID